MRIKARYVGANDAPLPSWGKVAAGVKRRRWTLFLAPKGATSPGRAERRSGADAGATGEPR